MKLSRHQLYANLFFLLPVIYFLSLPITTTDLAVWTAQGRYFFIHGSLLRHDVFSFVPTLDLVYPVLSCLLYGLIYLKAGLIWVSIFHKFVLLALSGLWHKSSLKPLKSPWSPLHLALILFVWLGIRDFCVDRPALLATIPFLLSFLILQREARLGLKEIIALLVINVLWVNIHGSWLLLSVMLGWRVLSRSVCLLICKEIRPRASLIEAAGFFGTLATSAANPFGLRVFDYVAKTVVLSRSRGITEWRPTDLHFHFPLGLLYYSLLAALSALVIHYWRSNRGKLAIFFCSPFLPVSLLGVLAIRNTVWSFVALLPFAFQMGLLRDQEPRKTDENRRWLNTAIVGATLALGIAATPQVKPLIRGFFPSEKKSVFDRSTPVEFARYLDDPAHPKGRVFNDWEFGGYLMLEQPDPIFMDARNIIYTSATFSDYRKITQARTGWEKTLESYHPLYALLKKDDDAPLVEALSTSENWSAPLQDRETILFARSQ